MSFISLLCLRKCFGFFSTKCHWFCKVMSQRYIIQDCTCSSHSHTPLPTSPWRLWQQAAHMSSSWSLLLFRGNVTSFLCYWCPCQVGIKALLNFAEKKMWWHLLPAALNSIAALENYISHCPAYTVLVHHLAARARAGKCIKRQNRGWKDEAPPTPFQHSSPI